MGQRYFISLFGPTNKSKVQVFQWGPRGNVTSIQGMIKIKHNLEPVQKAQ